MAFKVDFSKFKKRESTKDHTILQHVDGHELRINHNALSPEYKKQLQKLPALPMAGGGLIKNPGDTSSEDSKSSPVPAESSALALGAKGGKVDYEEINPPEPKEHLDYEPIEDDKIKDVTLKAEGGAVDEPADDTPVQDSSAPNVSEDAEAGEAPQPAEPPEVSPDAPGMPAPPANAALQAANTAVAASGDTPPPDLMAGYTNQVKGIGAEAKAQAQQAADQSKQLKIQAAAQMDLQNTYQKHFNELDSERKAFQQDIVNQHIDPNHYLGSMDTGKKISTGLALILGGMGGGGHGNVAMDFLNKQIDRDIEAQKSNLGKKETLLSANMQQFHNIHDATEMTRTMMNDALSAQLQQASLKAASPLAKARAQQMIGQIQQQVAPSMQMLAMRKALTSGDAGQQDPASFVPFVVPKEQQGPVFKEIKDAQHARASGDEMMKLWDQASKENTVMKTGAGLLRTPASIKSLSVLAFPLLHDALGRVNETEQHTFQNILPQPGDSHSTLTTKKQALESFIQSKRAAPTAKGFGIDLDRFQSTTQNPEMKLTPQQRSFVEFARRNPNDPRSPMILKKLGLQ